MRRILWTVVLSISLVSLATTAAEFWEKKDFRQWSEKDCQKLLKDSPWARQRTLSQVYITPIGDNRPQLTTDGGYSASDNPGNPQDDPTLRERQGNPQTVYQVQFRSALPVRQAMVRLRQIQVGYDKLPEDQRQAFDDQVTAFLSQDVSNAVIVYVSYSSTVQNDALDLHRYWSSQTTDTLRNSTFLLGAEGRKVELMQYVVDEGGRGFQLAFSRNVGGEPLVSANDKALQVEFMHPNIRGQGQERVLLEFKINKMLVNGQLVF